MTEKRFVNENDGDIRDTSTMIIYYCLSLTGKELCDLLNEQEERIKELEWSNKILRANRKSCEKGRIFERKQWEKTDKMRIEHIKFLQKRLKKNGLSIYINGDLE